MATLAAVNDTLLEVSNNTKETSKGISAFVKYIEKQEVKDFENEREAKANRAKLDKAEARSNKSTKSKSDGGLFDGLSNLGKVGLIGSALALGPKIGAAIVKRIPALAVIGFADEIAETLLGPNFEQETKETLSRGLKGGGLGALLGKRFILPFAALGALATDENKKMLKDIGKNLKTNWDASAKVLAPFLGFLPSFDNILKFIGTGTTNGLKAIKGFTESGFKSEEFQKNWGAAAGLLGSVAFLLAPGKFMKALKFLATFAFNKKRLVGLIMAAAGGKIAYDLANKEEGDPTFGSNMEDFAAGAALVGGGTYFGVKALKNMRGVPTQGDMDARSQQYKNKPGSINKTTKRVVGVDGNDTTIKKGDKDYKAAQKKIQKLAGKTPVKISTLLKFAKGNALFGGISAISELAQMHPNYTVEGVAGALGGLGGTLLGSLVGGAAGMAGGPVVAAITSGIGGLLGYFGGDIVTRGLAEWLMGKPITALPFGNDALNSLLNSKDAKQANNALKSTGPKAYGESPGALKAKTGSSIGVPQNDYNQRLKNNMYNMSGIGDAGITNVSTGNKVNSDNTSSTSNTSVSNTSVSSRGGILDLQDQFGFGLSQT